MERGREASVIVCDDVRTEMTGKLIVIGVYTTDIAIFSDEQMSPQLQFLFYAECDHSDPFKSIKFEVQLPGEKPAFVETANLPPPPPITSGRSRSYIRQLLTVAPATLRPGKITARVVHDRGEIPVSAGWIRKIDRPNAPTTFVATP